MTGVETVSVVSEVPALMLCADTVASAASTFCLAEAKSSLDETASLLMSALLVTFNPSPPALSGITAESLSVGGIVVAEASALLLLDAASPI
jgi:hypothetical protein